MSHHPQRPDARADATRQFAVPPRRSRRVAGVVRDLGVRSARATARRVDAMFSEGGPGFRKLAIAHAASTAGDTLVALALAGTLFFNVPSTEARGKVALYLVMTLAPFALLGPLLGILLVRFPNAYHHGLVAGAAARVVIGLAMAFSLDSFWLFPLAFLMLVLSRLHGISRASLLPVALDEAGALVAANARLAKVGVLAGGVAVPFGAAGAALAGPALGLVLAAMAFAVAAIAGGQLPHPPEPEAEPTGVRRSRGRIPREVRLAQAATGGVRLLNGFLLLLLAFAFREGEAGAGQFAALLGAAGIGFLLGAMVSPWLERRLREEPMVVVALAIEAGAAFIAAQAFGLPAASALAAAAGLSWGTAKLAFDGLLQATVDPVDRAVAFTRSETLFQLAWVIGAFLPVALPIPTTVGLISAGIAALVVQVLLVAGLLPVLSLPSLEHVGEARAQERLAARAEARAREVSRQDDTMIDPDAPLPYPDTPRWDPPWAGTKTKPGA